MDCQSHPLGASAQAALYLTHAVDEQLCDHARGNRHQHVIAAVLHPVVATRRLVQTVAAPVVDHVVPPAVLRWNVRALYPRMVWPCATIVACHRWRWWAMAMVDMRRRCMPWATLPARVMGAVLWPLRMHRRTLVMRPTAIRLRLRQRGDTQNKNRRHGDGQRQTLKWHGARFLNEKDSSPNGCYNPDHARQTLCKKQTAAAFTELCAPPRGICMRFTKEKVCIAKM